MTLFNRGIGHLDDGAVEVFDADGYRGPDDQQA
jgi:hypothetical protein